MPVSTSDKCATFRRLHDSGCFVIPNPWDAGSAVLLQSLGFKALASSSAGMAWSMAKPDNKVERDDVLAHLRALTAAENAFAGLHELNQGRAIAGVAPLKVGLGLHVGKVVYGNIGSRDRLDFTVIGRAVNEVARLEAQTKAVDRPLLASAAFADAINRASDAAYRLESVGFHALRGVREPQELFTLPAERLAGYE